MLRLSDGYEIYKVRNGKKVVLVWWNPDDMADVQLPTVEELFDEANIAAKAIMESIKE